jgi:tRNA-specific 2-thiouridylase
MEFNCNVEILNDIEAKVTLERANEAISPGQSAVFYSGDILLGGGIIDRECAE